MSETNEMGMVNGVPCWYVFCPACGKKFHGTRMTQGDCVACWGGRRKCHTAECPTVPVIPGQTDNPDEDYCALWHGARGVYIICPVRLRALVAERIALESSGTKPVYPVFEYEDQIYRFNASNSMAISFSNFRFKMPALADESASPENSLRNLHVKPKSIQLV